MTMHKDAQKYFTALDDALKAFNESREKINSEHMVPASADRYDEKWAPVFESCRRAEREAIAQHNMAERKAYSELVASDNPLIKWIGENIDFGYAQGHVNKILPLIDESGKIDMVAADDVAAKGDWCSEWSEFVNQASEAGVLDGSGALPAELELRRYIRRYVNSNLYDRQLRGLKERLDKALEEARNFVPEAPAEDVTKVEESADKE